MRVLFGLLLALLTGSASASPQIQPLLRGSYQKIISAHAGKPFIVAMWSVSCTHCAADLAVFSKLARRYADFDLVLIATDTPEQEGYIAEILDKYTLLPAKGRELAGKVESWVFADSYTERLHFEVDPQWYGELPRTYFFDARGKAKGVSGVVDEKLIKQWLNFR